MSVLASSVLRRRRRTGGSALLHSAAGRALRLLPVLAAMWLLVGWALDWW
ncbi:MAG: hypothetical protein WCY98_03125 [Castellaniella sp.]